MGMQEHRDPSADDAGNDSDEVVMTVVERATSKKMINYEIQTQEPTGFESPPCSDTLSGPCGNKGQ